ncbi:MAG: hypothetical protein M9894_17535 [Planctomycetes bacterium]|nr:hypothetical protein [Planctomycetota bacterium]
MTKTIKPTERQAAMHETHREWRVEHATWRDEAEIWVGQYHRALADLARVEAQIREHGAALLEHGAALGAHERAIALHERELADLAGKGLGEQYDPATPEHETWIVRHTNERAAHEARKAHHHRVVALVKRLAEAAAELRQDA